VRRIWFLLPTVAIACAHQARPDEAVLRIRDVVGVEEDGAGRTRVVVAEVDAVDDRPPRVAFLAVHPSGAAEILGELQGEEAAAIARRVAEGAPLREAACGAARACGGVPAAAEGGVAELGGRLEGWRLVLRTDDRSKWGDAWVVELEGEGRKLEVLRAVAQNATLVVLGDDAAALLTSTRAGPFRTGDAVPIDPWVQASRLLVAAAEDALARGDAEAAAGLVDRAASFEPTAARLHFTRARILARAGADVAQVTDALGRAVAIEPTLYRMEARTNPDFEALREDEAFAALVRPRPLPGSNRAGRPPVKTNDTPEPAAPPERDAPDEPPPIVVPPQP